MTAWLCVAVWRCDCATVSGVCGCPVCVAVCGDVWLCVALRAAGVLERVRRGL